MVVVVVGGKIHGSTHNLQLVGGEEANSAAADAYESGFELVEWYAVQENSEPANFAAGDG